MKHYVACLALLWLTSGQAAPAVGSEMKSLPTRQAAQARLSYMQHCMGCHLPDGSGAPDKGIPSMRDMLGQFLAVPGGRAFIVQVPGVMNSALSDQDIALLMNWLLPQVSLATLPPGTAPYTGAEITELRRHRPVDIPATRQALIKQMQINLSH
jgi:mono/diheme cytochrome c family protein